MYKGRPLGTGSRRACRAGGGGVGAHACQQRQTVCQGSSQLCTWRSARGQDGGRDEELVGAVGQTACCPPSAPFFPRSRRLREREGEGGRGGQRSAALARCVARSVLALGPPTEAERTADQGPMAADGAVGADLEVGPAQFLLDL